MNGARDRVWLAGGVALQALVVAMAALAARHGQPPSVIVLRIAASFIPYGAVLVFSRALRGVRTPGLFAALATFALGAVWLCAPPVLSDDLYRYLWEGRLWLEGVNPYAVAPNDPSVVSFRDDVWASINNKPLASIYPPLSQLLFVSAAWLGGGVFTVKLLALGGLALTAAAMARLTGDLRAALALGLNPLLSAESALNGHFDVLVGAAFFVLAWSLSRSRAVEAGIAVAAAVGLKLVGLVALPLLWRRPRVMVVTAMGSAVLVAPLALSRTLSDPRSGTGQFAARWRGNDSIFALVDWLSRQFLPDATAGFVARCAVVAVLSAVIAWVVYRRVPGVAASRILVWMVLLLSPQVHPWYLGWLLPLELAAGGRAALIWSAAVLCGYAPLDGWVENGVWDMPTWLQVSEYVVVGLALFFDLRRNFISFSSFEGPR